jgi:hypothetical protein
MNAEHRHELERNELAAGVQTLVEKAKSGQLINPRILGIVVVAVLVLGLWWYLASSGQSAASLQWRELDRVATRTDLEEYARANANTAAGRIARLQLARIKMGPDGLAKLNQRSGDIRDKAIAAVEEAKAEFVALAGEFKSDPTLQAQCLEMAATGELALVGIPKSPGSTEYRGSVDVAIAHLKTLAQTVGEATAAGKAALEQAADLDKNRDKVIDLGRELQTQLTPAPLAPDIKLPTTGLGNPVAPTPSAPTLPGNVTPSKVPPPASTPTTPPAAAAAGGAATVPPPTKK